MKHVIAAVLLVSLLLSGCGFFGDRISEPVTFYYVRSEYDFGREPAVITSEEREASGHRNDLSYLLALYLMGPAQEEHRSPLPPGTRILNPMQKGDSITLELSIPADTFADPELTLACACLTLTCLDITDAKEVTVLYRERSLTMTRASLTLIDESTVQLTTEETK